MEWEEERAERTLPERVLGRSETMYTFFGAANGPMTLRTWRTSSFVRALSLPVSYLNSLSQGRQSHQRWRQDR